MHLSPELVFLVTIDRVLDPLPDRSMLCLGQRSQRPVELLLNPDHCHIVRPTSGARTSDIFYRNIRVYTPLYRIDCIDTWCATGRPVTDSRIEINAVIGPSPCPQPQSSYRVTHAYGRSTIPFNAWRNRAAGAPSTTR